ncbi:MAG: stage 0 sporulation family protein [Armatimonadota bacterium]
MVKVCGIKFRRTGKIYYFDPQNVIYKEGDEVVVETVRGQELGQVIQTPFDIDKEKLKAPLKKVLSLATEEQKDQYSKYKLMAEGAFNTAHDKIREHKLDMKLVDVEYTLDGSKIIFYFSAKGRVDFRELVKDLAAIFKKRIEMHQIGVRDEAKICGALGPCGMQNCCTRFLSNFTPVAVNMAKDQNISLNPTKISGACGRLMCCLVFEDSVYRETLSKMPEIDSEVIHQDKIARVVELNAVKETILIEILDSGARLEVKLGDIRRATDNDRKKFASLLRDDGGE